MDKIQAGAGERASARENRVYVLVAAILASSMGFIDGSVLSIATPAIRADLGASLADAQWVSNAYLLFLSSLLLIGGAAGDRFGLRNVFAIGITLFVAASLVCADRAEPGLPDQGPRHPGRGRGADGAGQPRHHRQGLSARGARRGDRAVVLVLLGHHDSGAGGRRLRAHGAGRLELAAGVCHQPAARRYRAGAALSQGAGRPAGGGTPASISSAARSSPWPCSASPMALPATAPARRC